jgi:YVTN family beta-propeller protein
VLRAAQVDRSTLAAVLLVGGSSRIPLIAQMVSEEFGRPTVVSTHPKHAVALGAALLAEARRTNEPVALLTGADDGQTAVGSSIVEMRAAGVVSRETSGAPRADASRGAAAPAAVLTGPPAGPETPSPGAVDPSRQVPEPRTGDAAGGASAVGPATAAPPRQGPPGSPRHSAVVPPAPRAPWWSRYLALIVGLVLLATGAGVVVYLSTRPDGGSGAAGSPTTAPSASAPPTTAPPATAVPIPPVGQTIAAGATPGFVAAAPNGRQLYVANRDAGVVTVVNTASNSVAGEIKIPQGPPQFISFSRDGRRAYVSLWDKEGGSVHAISVLDTTTNKVLKTIQVPTRPFLSAVSPDGKLLYVPNHDSNTVSVIDTATYEVVTNISVAPNPHWVVFTRDGSKIYTADHDSNLMSVIDPKTNKVMRTIPMPTSPHSIAVHPTRPLIVVACFDANALAVVDTNTDKVVKTVPVGRNPQFAAWSADGRFAYTVNNDDNTVSVIDASTFTVTATIATGASPTAMAVLPDGTQGYVSNLGDGTLTELGLAG